MRSGKGKVRTVIISVILVLFSGLICLAIVPGFIRALSQLTWTQTACNIETSELSGEASDPKVKVLYNYEVAGKIYQSNQYELPSNVSPSVQEIKDRAASLVAGSTQICWYDSAEPSKAVLQKESLAIGFVLLFPLVLLTIVWVMVKVTFSTGESDSDTTSLRQNKKSVPSKFPGIGIYLFFMIFVVVGLGATYLFFWQKYDAVSRAKGWSETTCKVLESRVDSHTSKDSKNRTSTSYSVHVRYSYSYQGKQYVGTTYNPGENSSSKYFEKSKIVEALPIESETPCFFNPANPFESTINRDLEKTVWFGLIPLLFTFAGFLGIFATLTSNQTKTAKQGFRYKRKAQSRITGLIGIILTNLVWNGLVGAIGYAFFESWMDGSGALFPVLILIPFALIGALLLLTIPYAVLQLFNPSLNLEYSSEVPTPGSSFTVSWTLNRGLLSAKKIDIKLELVSQRSPDDNTERQKELPRKTAALAATIHTIEIVNSERSITIERGSAEVRIPAIEELPPTNEQEERFWKLTARLSIPFYPDAFEIVELKPGEDTHSL